MSDRSVRVDVFVNPRAGTADRLAEAEVFVPLIARGWDVRVVHGHGAEDLSRRAARSVREGADLVVAAGGDGTLNAVVNGVARVRGGLARVCLGLLPLGTGNDFSRTLGVPTDLPEAVAHLAGSPERRLDVASLNDRLFLNASGGGFTAETSARVTGRLKAWAGRLAYLVGGAQALAAHRPVYTEISIDGRPMALPLQLFAICNGRTLGGGHTLAPQARPDDGWLDVCLVHGTSTLDLVTLLPRLSAGGHVDDAQVILLRARRVSLRFAVPTLVNADGEVQRVSRCAYTVRPGAVRFVG